MSDMSQPPPQTSHLASRITAWGGDAVTVLYVAVIALIAQNTGFSYVMFPELGALSHGILKRPRGTWARAPLLLVVTPFLTSVVGVVVTQHMAYGLASVLLVVGSAGLIIRLLRSPIVPAISAGLLPLTLGVQSWWYPPSLLVGLVLLAGISLVLRHIATSPTAFPQTSNPTDEIAKEVPNDYSWIPFFLVFIVVAVLLIDVTGWRLLLFPPLVVIGLEMFAHVATCPWAGRPLILPIVCLLSATTGVLFVGFFAAGPLAAACSVALCIGILRVFNLNFPPAFAVGLLPFVIQQPNYEYPVEVAAGTMLLTILFMMWRRMVTMYTWREATLKRTSVDS